VPHKHCKVTPSPAAPAGATTAGNGPHVDEKSSAWLPLVALVLGVMALVGTHCRRWWRACLLGLCTMQEHSASQVPVFNRNQACSRPGE